MLKKIIIFLLVSPLALFASDPTYFFYVQTPEDVDSYFNIFNAIAKIFGSSDYLGLLKLVFVFGGFFVFAKGVIEVGQGNSSAAITEYGKYTLIATSLLLLIFGSTATVVIKSEKLPTYCSGGTSATAGVAVDNIPELLAYTFSFLDRTGKEITRLTETAFSVPTSTYGSYTLSDNEGYMGALKNAMTVLGMDTSRLLLDNNGTNISVDLPKMTQTIFSQCILIPFSSKGQDGMDEISKMKSSANLYEYLDNLYTSNPVIGDTNARDFIATYNGENWTCGDLWNTTKPYLEQFKDNAACLYPEVNAGAIMIITGSASPSESDFSNVALQSGLISELQGSTSKLSTGVSAVNYSVGKSKAEFVQTSMATGAYTAEMLPYLQSTLRALLYSMFPFIFVIVLFPGSLPIIKEYLKSILWIELWTPTAAVLNLFMIQNAENKMSTIYNTQGFTTVNAIDFLSTGSTIAGAAGYLYASVPALTWLFLTGSESMLSNFGEGMADSLMKNIRTEEILKDTSEISKRKEVSLKTGEDISLAEMQHYEAVQSGAISGAVLGTQMNLGMDSVKENEAYKVNKDVKTFKAKLEATGSATGESLGDAEAVNEATKSAGEIIAAKEKLMDHNGKLSKTAKTVVNEDRKEAKAKINAKEKIQISQEDQNRAKAEERAKTVEKAIDNKLTEKVDEALGVKSSPYKAAIRAAQTTALEKNKKMHSDQLSQIEQGEMVSGSQDKNGLAKLNLKKITKDILDEGHKKAFNEKKERAYARQMTENGETGEEVGKMNAHADTEQVVKTKTRISLAKELYGVKENEAARTIGENTSQKIEFTDKDGNLYTYTGTNFGYNKLDKFRGNVSEVHDYEYYKKYSETFQENRQYLTSLVSDSMLALEIGKIPAKLKKLQEERYKAKIEKTNKKLKEKFNFEKMSKAEKKEFKRMLKSLRELGVTNAQLLNMSHEEMINEEKKLKEFKDKKAAEKAVKRAERAEKLRKTKILAEKALRRSEEVAEAILKKNGLKIVKNGAKLVKGGTVTILTAVAGEALEATNSNIGHIGAKGVDAIGAATDTVFSGAFHGGLIIGFVLKGDFTSAKYYGNKLLGDFKEGYTDISSDIKDMYHTAKQLKLHDIADFAKGSYNVTNKVINYVVSGDLIDDSVDVYNKYSPVVEYEYKKATNYVKNHSTSEMWRDLKGLFY